MLIFSAIKKMEKFKFNLSFQFLQENVAKLVKMLSCSQNENVTKEEKFLKHVTKLFSENQ